MTQQAIQALGGVFKSVAAIDSNFNELYGQVFAAGNIFYCDAVNGSDTANDGKSPSKAFSTLAQAYGSCVSGHNDIVVIIGNGAASGTQRLSANFAWAKDATHLVGVCSPALYSQRARIAPTAAVAAFANFFTVTGNGCLFQNIQWFHGFDTGTTAQICLTLTSVNRNVFRNCHIAGMGDTASGNSATSRSLKISGGGENLFQDCVIGLDTGNRSAANASVEFAAATARNVFRNCHFPFLGDDATALGYIGSGAGCVDRHQTFENCAFINAIQSTSTTMSALGTLPASAGGLLLFRYCTLVGITEFGSDATTRGQCYVDGGTVTAATAGIAVNPT